MSECKTSRNIVDKHVTGIVSDSETCKSLQNVLWPSSKSSTPVIHSPGWVKVSHLAWEMLFTHVLRCTQSVATLIIAKSQKLLAKSATKSPADMTCRASTQQENRNKHSTTLEHKRSWYSMRFEEIKWHWSTFPSFPLFSDNDSVWVCAVPTRRCDRTPRNRSLASALLWWFRWLRLQELLCYSVPV